MTIQQKVQEMIRKIFDIISTKEITNFTTTTPFIKYSRIELHK
jgi:hypothetical protein